MRLHIIPVGGDEPIHQTGECWCFPLHEDVHPNSDELAIYSGLAIHNAKDGRERFERQGLVREHHVWVHVAGA